MFYQFGCKQILYDTPCRKISDNLMKIWKGTTMLFKSKNKISYGLHCYGEKF